MASERLPASWPELVPWLHLGLGLRTPGGERGLQAGLDVSVLLGSHPLNPLYNPQRLTPALRDNGSRLLVRYRPGSWGDGEEVALSLLPLSADRLRLGWAYPATWGSRFSGGRTWSAGAHLQVLRDAWHAFAAVKTPGDHPVCGATPVAPMAGVGLSLPFSLRAELQAGSVPRHAHEMHWTEWESSFCQQDTEFLQPPSGPPVQRPVPSSTGASARLVHQQGEPIGGSVDFGLYGSAPELFEELFHPERYPGGFASSISLEATHAVVALQGATAETRQSARANTAALQARLRWDFLRVHALALVRSAAATAINDSDLWPVLLAARERQPEAGLTLGADYHLPSLALTPGAVLRVTQPAAVRHGWKAYAASDTWPPPVDGWAVLTPSGFSPPLPQGEAPQPSVSGRATLKWEPASWASVAGELSYTWQPNHVPISGSGPSFYVPCRNPGTCTGYTDGATPLPSGPGFQLLVQARY